MRTIVIPTQTIIESIQSFNYQANLFVYVVIGVGKVVDGVFVFDVPQQFSSYYIKDQEAVIDPDTGKVIQPAINDFTDLMTQFPDANFGIEDLWVYIDRIRSRH
jgi:hypothetical protein